MPASPDWFFKNPDAVAKRIAWLDFRAPEAERYKARALFDSWHGWAFLHASDDMLLGFWESTAHWNLIYAPVSGTSGDRPTGAVSAPSERDSRADR